MPTNNRTTNKPPLGLLPKFLWQRNRATDILEALQRYNDSGVPGEEGTLRKWIDELSGIMMEENARRKAVERR